MKTIYCVLLLLCPYMSVAQHKNTGPLGIGEPVPDVAVSALQQGKITKSSLGQYRGKVLVLDFISTGCAGCVKTLPLLNRLQEQFAGSLQVLLVSSQPRAAVNRFLQNTPAGRKQGLPFVTDDSVLRSFFPYEYISHLVWIGPDGIVKAITEAEYFTAANIEQALQQQPLNWPVKNDIAGIDLAPPFLQLNSQLPASGRPAALYYSAFYRCMPGLPQGMQQFTDSAAGTVKTLLVNQAIPELYRRLLKQGRLPLSHIILHVPERAFYAYSDAFYRAGWERYNAFTYEAVQPLYLPERQRFGQLMADVNRYTQTRGYLTDTLVPGFVLRDTATATLPLLYTRLAGDSVLSISGLLYTLNNNYGNPPVSDGRNNQAAAWLLRQGPVDFNDMAALNRLLLAYGLVLQPQPQRIRALVITQTGPYPFIHSPKLYTK